MTPEEKSRKRLGDFEIVRELGRGGMGIVYEARQVSLNRKVALKVISGSLGLSSKAVLRFQREAEAAGKLHHTNIVPIYSTGQDDGAHYYTMELIDGPSLDQVIRSLRSGDRKSGQVSGSAATMAVAALPTPSTNESVLDSSSGAVETPAWVSEILGSPPVSAGSTPSPKASAGVTSSGAPSSNSYFDAVATMIAGVADALEHAHDNGVIHRDVKPANLLLSKDGRVSINDFGLARMLEQPGMTISGEFVGSPLYMSPEQITAGRAPLNHRTDIYALGATLYQLLTLEPPFPGQSRDEVIAQILHKEPIPLRRHNSKLPVDLETICLQAMQKDPDRRYQTAGQLAEDLRRFVNRHAISARRIGLVERAVRWVRKNKALTAMACLTLVVGLGAAAYVYVSDREHRRDDAKNRALMAAMSGNIEAAIVEISNAADLGAKPSWQLMLNGQVENFEGRPKEALSRFKSAVDRDPDSVMARSMLAGAYLDNMMWAEYLKAVDELEKLPVRTAEDHLFKGIAITAIRPEDALKEINLAIRERPSFTLAKVSRAAVKTFVGQDRDEVHLVLDALDDLRFLSQDLDDNVLLSSARVNARLTVYVVYRRDEQVDEATEYLRKAESDVEHLEAFPGYHWGNQNRLTYYAFKSDLDAMARVMREAVRRGNSGFGVDQYSAVFYGAGKKRIQEALDQLARIPAKNSDPHVVWARTVLLSETSVGRESAVEILDEFIQRYPRQGGSLPFDIWSRLFLQGQRGGVAESAGDRGEKNGWARDPVGALSKLYRRVGNSEREETALHFAIGINQLAHGNRPAAKKSFKKSADSSLFFWTPSVWSRAFLARMNEDDTWPDWLPAKPVGSDAK